MDDKEPQVWDCCYWYMSYAYVWVKWMDGREREYNKIQRDTGLGCCYQYIRYAYVWE
jgi:hypothetical protein